MSIRKAIIALGILTVFGLLRWPLESAQTRAWKDAHILAPQLNLSLREKISQNSFAAALGGARSFVASIENLRAFVAWETQEWGLVEQRFRLIQELQPRVPSYWETGAWHMAYNASGWYLYDWEGPRGEKNPAALERLRREFWERYIRKGQEMLADGIRNNPESWRLIEQAAMLAGDPLKLPDHRLAAEYYGMAAALPEAPDRVRRFEAYELSYLPDRQDEALAKLSSLYAAGDHHHVPTLLSTLLDLQMGRQVPDPARVPLEKFGATRREIYARLKDYAEFRRNRQGTVSAPLFAFIQDLEKELSIPGNERLVLPEENISQ